MKKTTKLALQATAAASLALGFAGAANATPGPGTTPPRPDCQSCNQPQTGGPTATSTATGVGQASSTSSSDSRSTAISSADNNNTIGIQNGLTNTVGVRTGDTTVRTGDNNLTGGDQTTSVVTGGNTLNGGDQRTNVTTGPVTNRNGDVNASLTGGDQNATLTGGDQNATLTGGDQNATLNGGDVSTTVNQGDYSNTYSTNYEAAANAAAPAVGAIITSDLCQRGSGWSAGVGLQAITIGGGSNEVEPDMECVNLTTGRQMLDNERARESSERIAGIQADTVERVAQIEAATTIATTGMAEMCNRERASVTENARCEAYTDAAIQTLFGNVSVRTNRNESDRTSADFEPEVVTRWRTRTQTRVVYRDRPVAAQPATTATQCGTTTTTTTTRTTTTNGGAGVCRAPGQ